MKARYFKNHFFKLFIVVLLLGSCSAEDGDTGPMGPAGADGVDGAQGPQGEQGLKGEQGLQGETGSANVVYSDWILEDFPEAVNVAEMVLGSFPTDRTELDPDTDLILVYGRRQATAELTDTYQLPFTLNEGTATSIIQYYGMRVGFNDDITEINIWVRATNGGSPGNSLIVTQPYNYFNAYRYVIIRGAQLDGAASKSKVVDYTTMSYKEIKDMFDLED